MARPKKQIDGEMVKKLASIFCTQDQIATIMGCSVDTLARRFADVIKEGREHGKYSLLKKQFELAVAGNVTLLIWLGKQHLGQSDKQETINENTQPVKVIIERAES